MDRRWRLYVVIVLAYVAMAWVVVHDNYHAAVPDSAVKRAIATTSQTVRP